MAKNDPFDLLEFLPYLLNQAAEAASDGFRRIYKAHFGMLRTDWRVLFHLGIFGQMTARDICRMARLHKTEVSRAVSRLEARRFLTREENTSDRRFEQLSLTRTGRRAYLDLRRVAERYETELLAEFDAREAAALRRALKILAARHGRTFPPGA